MTVILIPGDITRFEQEIKKSRFITYAAPASSPSAAENFIVQKRNEHPDARHLCSAFVIGKEGGREMGQNDDGEPGGTAGLPMLNVLQHSDVTDIVVVVIRYFGGIKLGKGGLARAYSSSVSEILKIMPVQEKQSTSHFVFTAEFAQEDQIRRLLQTAVVDNLVVEYGQQIRIECDIPLDQITSLKTALSDMSRGRIKLDDE